MSVKYPIRIVSFSTQGNGGSRDDEVFCCERSLDNEDEVSVDDTFCLKGKEDVLGMTDDSWAERVEEVQQHNRK
jgi:hypothetical protein